MEEREIKEHYERIVEMDHKRGAVIVKKSNEEVKEFSYDAVYDWTYANNSLKTSK
jgi:hypothetical protein